MLHAAMPVEAVTATASWRFLNFSLREVMISRRRTDFPVPVPEERGSALAQMQPDDRRRGYEPADPVKKTFLPSWTTSLRTICCSGLRTTFCLMFIESLVRRRAFELDASSSRSRSVPPTVWKELLVGLAWRDDWTDSRLSHGKARFLITPALLAEVEAMALDEVEVEVEAVERAGAGWNMGASCCFGSVLPFVGIGASGRVGARDEAAWEVVELVLFEGRDTDARAPVVAAECDETEPEKPSGLFVGWGLALGF